MRRIRGGTLAERFALRDGEAALSNIFMSLQRRLMFTITRSRRDVKAKIREMSKDGVIKEVKDGQGKVKEEILVEGGYGKDLDMFGIPRKHRNPFELVDKKNKEFNIKYAKHIENKSKDPAFLKKQWAMDRLVNATQQLGEYASLHGWHSAMFTALAERRLGRADIYSEAELIDLTAQMELLGIDLKNADKIKNIGGRSDSMQSVSLNDKLWQELVAAQHKKIATDYRGKLRGAELKEKLKELKNAQDVLLNMRNRNTITALVEREHYANYYRLLDLDPKLAATYDEEAINKAFRKISRREHPDKGGSKEKYQEIMKAKEFLLNPNTRAGIDAYLRQHLHGEGL